MSTHIVDGAIVAADLATDAVETLKIKDANVTAAKLATDAVETLKIKDLNVTAAKLAADAVETAKIKDLNVTTAKLANNAVTSAKLDTDITVTTMTVTKFIETPSSVQSISASGTIPAVNSTVKLVSAGGEVTAGGIAAGTAGQTILLIGTSNTNTVTIADSGTIALDSDISFTLGAGDTMRLTYDGTVWYEVSRSDN